MSQSGTHDSWHDFCMMVRKLQLHDADLSFGFVTGVLIGMEDRHCTLNSLVTDSGIEKNPS